MKVSASAGSSGDTWARSSFWKASNWLMADNGLLRSMDAMAPAKTACKGADRDTSDPAEATNRTTASAVVMTSIATAFVSLNKPSLTTKKMECAPTGKTAIATTPLSSKIPSSYQA